jgi:hypothetical protein
MRNTLIAAAASFCLLGAGPLFAADNSGGQGTADQTKQGQANEQSSNVDTHCAEILANPASHSASDVDQCKAKKTQ